ncbi:MAG: TIGR04282 family arsenosugar biosynthesis glycosyltransferase [Bacteroidia bacterium]
MRNALLIFIKNPALGKVKTRLAKTVGDYNALKIYQYLLDHTMEITYELDKLDKFVYYNEFIPTKDEWPANAYQKALQKGDGLGEKMSNAFKEIFSEDYTKVVLMQPDCPKMTDTMIEKAFKVLDTHDFVIGPTMDGGFYLVGMKEHHPQLFANKTYSTAEIYNETIAEIEKMGKSFFKLPALVDIDMEEDLGKLRKMIKTEE